MLLCTQGTNVVFDCPDVTDEVQIIQARYGVRGQLHERSKYKDVTRYVQFNCDTPQLDDYSTFSNICGFGIDENWKWACNYGWDENYGIARHNEGCIHRLKDMGANTLNFLHLKSLQPAAASRC